MIDLAFNGGKPRNPNYVAYIGANIKQQFLISGVLAIIVICLIPVMLFAKPCCFRAAPDHEDDEEV